MNDLTLSNIELSLCLIVRNEEASLERCLKSAASLVDEIIVVDTGSTDKSLQIAETFGAKIFKTEWEDDFSKARNHALEKASGHWILVLDADEVLGYVSRDTLYALLHSQEAEGYFIKIISILGSNSESETSEDWVVRLFRNKPQYRFQGVIHEQVKPAISSASGDASIKMSDLTIYHDGYLTATIKQKKKVKRNSRIIQKALVQNPNHPFLLYSLGCEFFLSDDYTAAISHFQKALAVLPENEGYMGDLLIKTGLCLYMLGEKETFLHLLKSYKEKKPFAPEILFLSGLANLERGNLAEAEADIKKCLETLPSNTLKHFVIKEHQLYQALAEIHEQKGLWLDTAQMYFMSVKSKPAYLYPVQKIIDVCRLASPFESGPFPDLDMYLDFSSPEKKYALLSKLNWQQNPDIAGFLILGLLRDLLQYISHKEYTLSQLLSLKTISLIKLGHEGCLNNLQLTILIALSKAFLALSSLTEQEIGRSKGQCFLLYKQIKEILLWKEPVR